MLKKMNKNACISHGIRFLFLFGLLIAPAMAFSAEKAAKDGDQVEIDYVGKLQDNTVFDKSEGRGPLKFEVGTPNIIPGMNKAVVGMKVGESKTVSIPPDEAYGEYDQKLIFEVPTDKLPVGIKAGDKLTNPQGHVVVVKNVNGSSTALDGNHFLAGKTLVFEIKMLTIN